MASAGVLPPTQAATTATPGEVLLRVEGVSKSFSGVQALSAVDMQVRRGEILGLVGPNGSGKSTMINVVSGHYVATAGRIEFAGRNLVGMEAHRVAQLGISRTYQIPRPFAQLSVLDNVTLSAMFGHAGLGRAAAEAQAQRCMAFTGLQSKIGRAHV